MEEKRKIFHALFMPVVFLIVIWTIKVFEITMEMDFSSLGVLPRTLSGIRGIFFSPLIHADWKHLFDNSIPLFVLGMALFYFYQGISYRIFTIIYIMSGILLWIIGRDAHHIGASGVIYGLATFLFFSGVARRITHLMAISLLVVFLYGGMIWGLLPFDYEVSWEGHLSGAIVGLVLAFLYSDKGPERQQWSWDVEPEDEEEDDGEMGREGDMGRE